jgi:citrate lyase subunit beta/citryl-CoA lyase
MAAQVEGFRARSWLFAPGDSEKKMTKAMEGVADIVLIDLEDAVAPESKIATRQTVHDFIKANPAQRERLWVRINPFDGPYTLGDLAAVMPANPGGIMLPKVYSRAEVEKLDHMLSVLEVANGIEEGSTKVIVLITETAEAMFHTGSYKG